DVVDAIAAGARRNGVLWGPAATRWTGIVAAILLLLLALGSALLAGPPWLVPGLVALGLAVLCLLSGTVTARAMTDATAGALVAARSAAIAVSVVLLLTPALPLVAVRMGKVPMPALPRSVEDLVRDEPMPPAVETYAAVARADELFTGLLAGTVVAAIASLAV